MEKLTDKKAQVEPVSEQLLEVLNIDEGKKAVADLVKKWSELKKLQTKYKQYLKKNGKQTSIEKKNKAQHKLRQACDPFFAALHKGLKQIDKIVRQHEKQNAEKAKAAGKRNATNKQKH